MKKIYSLKPIIGKQPSLLILGSMPGVISLTQQRYYAHPQNAFWTIIARLVGGDPDLSYPEKTKMLKQKHIALWDVLYSCERDGSMDHQIRQEKPNNITALIRKHPIRAIFLNGGKASTCFYRFINQNDLLKVKIFSLPSTSPANTRLTRQEKYLQWKKAWDQIKK